MISLIFDTETTGLPSKNLAPDDPNQARIMQIAMLLLDDDKEIGCFYSRIIPGDWPPIHPKAFEAHGLSLEDCDNGIGISLALKIMQSFMDIADVVVAHNMKFDAQLLQIEADREVVTLCEKNRYCTMEILTPIMGLKRMNGAPKWPNLTEALHYCYPGEVIDKAHDALGDVRATAKVWRWLIQNNKVIV